MSYSIPSTVHPEKQQSRGLPARVMYGGVLMNPWAVTEAKKVSQEPWKIKVGQLSQSEVIGSRNVGWLSLVEESLGTNGEVSKLMGGRTNSCGQR